MSQKTQDMSDLLSKIMGSYLLRGYTLLDDYCQICKNPLMRSRNSQLYCIYCNEVNTEPIIKPNTVTNINNENDKFNTNTNSSEVTEMIEDIDDDFTDDIEVSRKVVQNKLRWATDLFANCNTVNECTQYCHLIKTCSDTLQSLNKLNIHNKRRVHDLH